MPETKNLPWIARVPTNAFGAVLGLGALGLLWRQSVFLRGAAEAIAEGLFLLATLCFAILAAAYLAKCVLFPDALSRDIAHPVRHAFFGAISMGLLILAAAAQPDWPVLGRALWLIGVTFHFAVAVVCLGMWLRGIFSLNQVGPAWLIPPVGGVLASISIPPFAADEISWLMFSVAMSFGAGVFALNLFRLAFRPPPPAPATPTLAILLAPPGLLFLAWVSLNGGEIDPLARGFFYVGLVLTLVLIGWVPRFVETPFSLAWWAYTFPLVAVATAAMEFHRLTANGAFELVAAVYFVLANAVVAIVLCGSAIALLGGRLFPPD